MFENYTKEEKSVGKTVTFSISLLHQGEREREARKIAKKIKLKDRFKSVNGQIGRK